MVVMVVIGQLQACTRLQRSHRIVYLQFLRGIRNGCEKIRVGLRGRNRARKLYRGGMPRRANGHQGGSATKQKRYSLFHDFLLYTLVLTSHNRNSLC